MRITFSGRRLRAGKESAFWCRRAAPGMQCETQGLPDQIRRKDEEPGDEITGANFSAQSAKKVAVSVATELTKQSLPDIEDCNWHQHKSKEQQAE